MKTKIVSIPLIIILIIILISCQKEKDMYQIPPWLGGSIIETLKEKGNYSIFLELAEKANYLEPIEKNLYTVFVADDNAFKEYFTSRGIKSVADLSVDEAKSLFTLNLINTPRSKQQLVYDYVNDRWQDSTSEYLSLFFRWPTNSEYLPQKENVKYNADYLNQELIIKSQAKFVPCFSGDFYGDYGGDIAGSDYTYFFPNSTWSGLQWYNASIIGQEARCSNGFIYFIDKVVPVMPSIEEYLRNNQDKFGIFYDIAQRFANYTVTEGEYVNNNFITYYLKSYTEVPDFALETGPYAGAYIRRNIFSAFVPSNKVFSEYLNNTILKAYPSIDSVPKVTLIYLIKGHITSSLNLPSKMKKDFFNSFGEKLDFDPYKNVLNAQILSNGAFFEIDQVMEPLAFKAVPGPLFYNNNYTTFLYALNSAKMISAISLPDVPVTVFAPDNKKLNEYGIKYDNIRQELQKRDVYGEWNKMKDVEIKNFVNDHIIFKKIENLSGEEFLIMNSGTGVYLINNSLIAGGNREAGDAVRVKEAINSNLNGILFLMDNVIKSPEEDFARYIGNHKDFSELFKLLTQAGMIDTIVDIDTQLKYPRLKFLQQYKYWTGFLPDNDAIAKAKSANQIPEDKDALVQFIRYHFVADKVISNMYSISTDAATTKTNKLGQILTLNINVQPQNMIIRDGYGNSLQVGHNTANHFVRDGIIHRINSVLKSE